MNCHKLLLRALGPAALATLLLCSAGAAQADGRSGRDTPDRVSEDEHDNDDRGPQPIWSSLRGGYQFLDLTTFKASEEEFTADLIPSQLNGPAGQLAVGVSVFGLTLGARGTVMALSNSSANSEIDGGTLWSLDGELGMHLATGFALDPFILLGGGYTQVGGLHVRSLDTDVQLHGYNVRAGVGVDYFVSENVALGVLGMGQLLFLTRPGVSASDLLTPEQVNTVGEAKARALEANGSSVGTAFAITAGPSVHF